MNEAYFPLFISLKNRRILIIGGGNIGARRAGILKDFGADLTVVAPEISEKMAGFVREKQVKWKEKKLSDDDIDGQKWDLVIAVSSDPEVNDRAAELCRKNGIPVNHGGDKSQCDFYFPGVVKEGTLVVGVTASGANHKLAKQVTEQIRKELKKGLGERKDGNIEGNFSG